MVSDLFLMNNICFGKLTYRIDILVFISQYKIDGLIFQQMIVQLQKNRRKEVFYIYFY